MSQYKNKLPPKWIDRFLQWRLPEEQFEEVQGDMHELYGLWVEEVGEKKARRMYMFNAFTFLRPLPTREAIIHDRTNQYSQANFFDMILNYLTIAYRNLWKNKAFSVLNTIGLALGITAFVFILQYIGFEKSVNRFHTNLPNLYRVLYEKNRLALPAIPPAISPLIEDNFAEVEGFCRIAGSIAKGVVTYAADEDQPIEVFREEKITYADASFFELFSFPTVQGSASALQRPNTVSISQSQARKYFGRKNALGKMLTLNNQFGKTSYTVTSVYQDFPITSDLQYDMIFSLQTLADPTNRNGNDWARLDNMDTQFLTTFFLVKSTADYRALEQKLNLFKKQWQPEDEDVLRLQPMKEMHLARSLSENYPTEGKLGFVYLLAGIAILILTIAWFNYINLSTVGALKRAKEVGIRKVVGASQNQLISQFLGESLLLNLVGVIMALLLIIVLQPLVNELTGKPLSLAVLQENGFWVASLLILLCGSLGSGSYTAFALSSFRPVQVLKGTLSRFGKGVGLRQALVVFQFSISIALIACTMGLYQQLQFMQNQNLGMNINQLLVLRGPSVGKDSTFIQRTTAFGNALAQLPYISDYSNTGSIPGSGYNFQTTGITRLNSQPEDSKKGYAITNIDDRFLPTYGVELVAGKNFTAEVCARPPKQTNQVLVNEKAALQLGFASAQAAVGQKIIYGREREIIGVVKDYNHQSLRQTIDPMIFMPHYSGNFFTIRLTTEQIQAKMAELEALYKQYYPVNPFEYFFLDENYNKQYEVERQYGNIFTIASLLAIFIACLGLFGLAAYTAQQRVKEIGIRKVLGASVSNITLLLSKDFLSLVLISFVIATPLSWYAMHRWLENFAYQIHISWILFALAGGVAFLIAGFTVSWQAIKTALANPVKSLRNE